MNLISLSLTIPSDGIAYLQFNVPGKDANILSSLFMKELDTVLDVAARDPRIKVLLITSAKEDSFIEGADTGELLRLEKGKEAEEKFSEGQEIFSKFAKLPFPSVAVIDGACLGAGLQLALAATFRIITDNPAAKLSMPEVSLGFVPGFGGIVRLPRLIGLTEAMAMILKGKEARGAEAVRIHLADLLYPSADISGKARIFADALRDRKICYSLVKQRSHLSLSRRFKERTFIGRASVFAAAKREIISETRGFYPAPPAALAAIKKSFRSNERKGFRIEMKAAASLAGSEVSANLIAFSSACEEMKKAVTADSQLFRKAAEFPVRPAVVAGDGPEMETIAGFFSEAGISAFIRNKDRSGESFRFLSYGETAALRKKSELRSLADSAEMSSADIVIITADSDPEQMKTALAEIEKLVSGDTIIAADTSCGAGALSSLMQKPERFVVFRFFSPAGKVQLVEIVRGERTDDLTVCRASILAVKLGKTPVIVKGHHGFLASRITAAYLNEALIMIDEGISFEEIDRALRNFGMNKGPFARLDEIGLEAGFRAAENISNAFPGKFPPGIIFSEIASDSSLAGSRDGKRFYICRRKKLRPNPALMRFIRSRGLPEKQISHDEIVSRCIMRMLRESILCLEEPAISTASHLDAALVLAQGFPSFRGGILLYADTLETDAVLSEMKGLEENYGQRFSPPPLLTAMADKNEKFYNRR